MAKAGQRRALFSLRSLLIGVVVGWVTIPFLAGQTPGLPANAFISALGRTQVGLRRMNGHTLGAFPGMDTGGQYEQHETPQEEPPLLLEKLRGSKRLLKEAARNGGGAANKASWDPEIWQATILVGMAAYRDFDCQDSVWSALSMAANPDRVSIGIYQQHAPEDPDCLAWKDIVCPPQNLTAIHFTPEDERQRRPSFGAGPEEIVQVCSALPRVKIKRVHFLEGRGPTVARYHTEQFLADEDFFLQVDSHSHFVYGWDIEVMRNWKATSNRKAVISGTYPIPHTRMNRWLRGPKPPLRRDAQAVKLRSAYDHLSATEYVPLDSVKPKQPVAKELLQIEGYELEYIPKTIAVICKLGFVEAASNMPRLEPAQFIINPGRPILLPYWTAGISFAPAQAVRDAPYDPYTPYLFDGEEFSRAARLWTAGYDLYAPFTDIVFHVYQSTYKRNKYWDIDWAERYKEQQRSARRIKTIFGLPVPEGPSSFDSTEIERFGLGKNRTLAEFLRFASVSLEGLTSRHICNDLEKGVFPTYLEPDPRPPPTQQATTAAAVETLQHTVQPTPEVTAASLEVGVHQGAIGAGVDKAADSQLAAAGLRGAAAG